MSDQILQNVKRFEAISDRMCYLEIQCRWFKVILINCYGPTEDKDEDIQSEFYEDLERVYNKLTTNNIKIILGDFNAKIGRESILKPTIGSENLHETSNDKGK